MFKVADRLLVLGMGQTVETWKTMGDRELPLTKERAVANL